MIDKNVKEITIKRQSCVKKERDSERKRGCTAVNKRGTKGRGSSAVLLSYIARTYATTSRAANRGLRAEGIPRLPPLRPIPFGRLCNSERRADRETKSKGWGQSTGPRSRVHPHGPREETRLPRSSVQMPVYVDRFSLLYACTYDI